MHHRHGDFGRRLSDAERLEIRRLVRAGGPYRVAAAAVGTTVKTVGQLVRETGGLPVRGRPRSPLRLSLVEREEISRQLVAGASLRAIARRLGRAPSTVSRELARNRGRRRYRAWRADARAIRRARRPRAAKLARNPRLRAEVERLLGLRWSPQQVAARLRLEHPEEREVRVSHETIYQSLFVQARGALRRELVAALRTGRVRRRAQRRAAGPGVLTDMVLISERPAAVRTARCPGTGRATSSSAAGAARRSPPWSSARPATCCSSRCPPAARRRPSATRSRRAS